MIIAECGINWLSDFALAQDLILVAKANGADLCKFQLYDTDAFPAYGNDADWNSEATKNYAIDKRHELTFEQAKGLFEYGKEIGIEVFFSVFTVERVRWCEEIGVKRYKVASKMRDIETCAAIDATQKPIIVSYAGEPIPFYLFRDNLDVLYCVSEYPAKEIDFSTVDFGEPNILASHKFNGFSDHFIGLDAAKIALARGAEIIEKHFCLTREGQEDNPGIAGSMTPDELRELKRWERVCKQAL